MSIGGQLLFRGQCKGLTGFTSNYIPHLSLAGGRLPRLLFAWREPSCCHWHVLYVTLYLGPQAFFICSVNEPSPESKLRVVIQNRSCVSSRYYVEKGCCSIGACQSRGFVHSYMQDKLTKNSDGRERSEQSLRHTSATHLLSWFRKPYTRTVMIVDQSDPGRFKHEILGTRLLALLPQTGCVWPIVSAL